MKSILSRKGSALVELVVAVAVVGVLAAASPPNFSSYETWAHNVYAQTHLRNLYLACKTYWNSNSTGSCSLPIARQTTYGFVQSSNVTIVMRGQTARNFSATAKHNSEETEYTVCADGSIQTTACVN